MRTTLDLDETLLAEAMNVTGCRTKTAAVHLGLETLVKEAARRRLSALHGSSPAAEAAHRRRTPPRK